MRPIQFITAALAIIPGVLAADKSAIISFKDGTPSSVVDEAKQKFKDAGAKITHEYKIITGFAVEGPESAISTMQTWDTGSKHGMKVEEDTTISINS